MKTNKSFLKAAIAELSTAGTKKFKTAKDLIALSEKEPDRLYPCFDAFCELLQTKNNIIKWSVFQIVSNLAAADKEGRIEGIMDRYLAPIPGPVMITAANAIAGAAKIAKVHGHLTNRIVQAILQVESAVYKTDECRNVAIGHAILALGTMGNEVKRSPGVVAFVERQCGNTRPGTRKKAELFLKELHEGPARQGA
jgi:hypothetical protein